MRLVLALAALLVAGLARADCERDDFVLAIDIGHSSRTPGATSARGVPEYDFNKRLAGRLLGAARKRGYKESFIVNDADAVLRLKDRTRVADDMDADLLISIHHDSMPAKYLTPWTYQGVSLRYGDQFRGHSIFYSDWNDEPEESRAFAEMLGSELRKRKLTPTLHHDGYRGRRLVNRELGIYRFDKLIVLHSADMPAVLFEAGVILNREEELLLETSPHQDLLVDGILDAVGRFCTTFG